MKLGLLRHLKAMVIRPREKVSSPRRGGNTASAPRGRQEPCRACVGLVSGPRTSSPHKLCADLEV